MEKGVKRAWPGDVGPVETWVEGAGTRTLQRGHLKVAEIFAWHGPPPTAAHSAAAAAPVVTAVSELLPVGLEAGADAASASDEAGGLIGDQAGRS